MARRVRDRSIGDSRERAGRRAAVAAAMVVLAGAGSAAVGAAGPASPSATPQTGDCLTGVWAYSAYSSAPRRPAALPDRRADRAGPGYVDVSSVDGSATGTLGPDMPNATYAVAMSGTGAMASLEDGTIRWYADAVTGGLTGIPGGGTQGAQALVPELPMTVSCDATTARLTTAGGTTITLTRSTLVPQPPTPLPAIPQRPQSGARLPGGHLGARHDGSTRGRRPRSSTPWRRRSTSATACGPTVSAPRSPGSTRART